MQKITPFLWFDKDSDEAMKFYASIFDNSKIVDVNYYPSGYTEGPLAGMEGKVINGIFELSGQRFMCLDGGPIFKFNPSTGFFVNCETAEDVERYYSKLVEGGNVMMPLDKYPFSEKFAWISDKYGVSWQMNIGKKPKLISNAIMFVGDKFGVCEEAINYYAGVFKDSKIETVSYYAEGEGDKVGKVKYSSFTLAGEQFVAMESSIDHKFEVGGAISFYIACADQAEVDYFWEKLSHTPEAEQCGWAKDRYGISWQIVPKALEETVGGKDPAGSKRAMDAMMQMKKLDAQKLWDAYNGK
jgi:predicted 3-demethylubiquinone-9 3-methyltransferase (glyoxalase superfamily)